MPAIAIRHLSKTFEQKGNSVEALRDIEADGFNTIIIF